MCLACSIDGLYENGDRGPFFTDGAPGQCEECGSSVASVAILLLVLTLITSGSTFFIIKFLDVSSHINRASGSFDLWMGISAGMGQLQRMMQIITKQFHFPEFLVDIKDAIKGWITLDIPSLAPPECIIPVTPYEDVIIRTTTVAMALPLLWLLVGVGMCAAKRWVHSNGDGMKFGHVFFHCAIALHSLFFLSVAGSAFGTFDCVEAAFEQGNFACEPLVEEVAVCATPSGICIGPQVCADFCISK
jgi:hypothetical protein